MEEEKISQRQVEVSVTTLYMQIEFYTSNTLSFRISNHMLQQIATA